MCKGSETCFKCVRRGTTAKLPKRPSLQKLQERPYGLIKTVPNVERKRNLKKVSKEKKITNPETRKIFQLYNMPKPNLPSYATALKLSSKKNIATQVCEKELFSQASVKDKPNDRSQNNVKISTLLETAFADTRIVSAPKPLDLSRSQQVTANVSKVSGRQTRSPQKDKQNQCSVLVPKSQKPDLSL